MASFFLSKAKITLKELLRNSAQLLSYSTWFLTDFSKFKTLNPNKTKNVLLVYVGAMGDTYNVVGLINAAKKKYPQTNFNYLTWEKNRKFIKSPDVNVVSLEEAKEMIKNKKIDAFMMFSGVLRTPELFDKEMRSLIKDIPFKITCDSPKIVPGKMKQQHYFVPFNKKVFNVKTNGFEDQLKAFQGLGFKIKGPEFHYTQEAEVYAKKFLKKHKIGKDEKIIFLHPGSGKSINAIKEGKLPANLWPAERWAELADKLIEKYNARIIIDGVGDEQEIVKDIVSKIKNKKKVINAAEKLSIEHMASLFKLGELLLSIDTGTVHVAAQVGIPMGIIFGSNDPKGCSPLSNNKEEIYNKKYSHFCKNYACNICNKVSMPAISVEEVFNSAQKLLKASKN